MTDNQRPATRRRELTIPDKLFRQLEKATSINEVKDIREKAEAVRAFAKSAKKGLEMQNKAAELKLRAERKAGEILTGLNLAGGDRKSNGHRDRLILEDLAISQNQSKRWQKEALLPNDLFEAYVQQAQQDEVEISSAALLRLVQKHKAAPTNGHHRGARLRPLDEGATDKPVRLLNARELSDLQQAISEINGHRQSAALLLGEAGSPELGVFLDAAKLRIVRRYLTEIDEAAQRLDSILN